MDDQCSIMSNSVYWDATSTTSDSTLGPTDEFVTPHGSLMGVSMSFRSSVYDDFDELHQDTEEEEEEEKEEDDNYETIGKIRYEEEESKSEHHSIPEEIVDEIEDEIVIENLHLQEGQPDIVNDLQYVDPDGLDFSSKNINNTDLDSLSEANIQMCKADQAKPVSVDINNNTNDNNGSIAPSDSVSVPQPSRPSSTKRVSWKDNLVRKISSTRSKIAKSFSHIGDGKDSMAGRNRILDKMRNSFRRRKSIQTAKRRSDENDLTESTSAVLGSDIDYFIFDEKSNGGTKAKKSRKVNKQPSIDKTPTKPKRCFPQDRYLTFNLDQKETPQSQSSNRRSHVQDNRSFLELAHALPRVLGPCNMLSPASSPTDRSSSQRMAAMTTPPPQQSPVSMDTNVSPRCVAAFIETCCRQRLHSLACIRQSIGRVLDLSSDDLGPLSVPSEDSSSAHVSQSSKPRKKYFVESLMGSPGVCVIINSLTRRKFVALKKSNPRNWTNVTSLLQHIEQDQEDPFPEDQWLLFPATTITNLGQEIVHLTGSHFSLITGLHLLACLQLLSNPRKSEEDSFANSPCLEPSRFLLVASSCSLVLLHNDMPSPHLTVQSPAIAATTTEPLEPTSINSIYNRHLLQLHQTVTDYLSRPSNTPHLISASYPLDIVFLLLIKLHTDTSLLLDANEL